MESKTFFGKDKQEVMTKTRQFFIDAVGLKIVKVKYDVNYATKQWTGTVFYTRNV